MQSFPCLEQRLREGCPRCWSPWPGCGGWRHLRHKSAPQTQQLSPASAESKVKATSAHGFKEWMKNAGRWQEYQICLFREGSFSTTPARYCPPLSVESSSSAALRELGWATKKNRGNHSFMSHPFLPFMLLGISLCVSSSQTFNYVASKRKESIPVWLGSGTLTLLLLSSVLFWGFQDISPMA